MELKLTSGGVGTETPFGSNRTFMELKFDNIFLYLIASIGSNRTFMELK